MRYTSGVMEKYAAIVSSASQGAVTTGRQLTAALGRSQGSGDATAAAPDLVISGG